MKRILGIGAALALAALISAPAVLAEDAPAAPAPAKPKPAIVFKVKDAAGADVTQDALLGKKTLLVFAQTACSQCRSEIEELNKRYESLGGKQIFVVLVDMTPDRALAFYQSMQYKMPLLLDPDFSIPPQVGVRVTPSTVLVGGDLKVEEMKTGFKKTELEEILGKL